MIIPIPVPDTSKSLALLKAPDVEALFAKSMDGYDASETSTDYQNISVDGVGIFGLINNWSHGDI